MIPFIIFMGSFILRLTLISKGPYHIDCLLLAIQAEETLDTLQLQFQYGTGYPLTMLLASFFILIARTISISDPVIAVNFMSVVFGSLSVAVFYFLVKKFFDASTAFFSSILFSISPIFLSVSVYGKSHTPSMFFLLLGLYFLIIFLKQESKKDLFYAGLFIGLFGAARSQELILMILPIVFLYFSLAQKDKFKNFLVLFSLIIAVSGLFHLPLIIQLFQKSRYSSQLSYYWSVNFLINFMGIFSTRLILCFNYFIKTFTNVGLLLSLAGFVMIGRYQFALLGFLLLWILVPLGFYGNLYSTLDARFLTILLPPFFIGQGIVFSKLLRKNLLIKLMSYCLFVIIICKLFTTIYPVLKFRHDHAILPDFALWITDMTEPNAYIIAADENRFLTYYGDRAMIGRPVTVLRRTDESELLKFKRKVDHLLNQEIPVYITTAGLYAYNRDSHFSNFFDRYYSKDYVGKNYYEDWHRGSLELKIYLMSLYRVYKRQEQDLKI